MLFNGECREAAEGFAVVSAAGLVTDVFITNRGSGYQSPPWVDISGGGGSGAAGTAEIAGGVGKVEITDPGTGYTSAPTLVFESANANGEGEGAEASVEVNDAGQVVGADRIQKLDLVNDVIGLHARVGVEVSAVAAPGTKDGTVTSQVFSTQEVVTLNGKSRLVTRRVSSGSDAKTGTYFPVRLILHAPASGGPASLMQCAYLGDRDGVSYAGTTESAVASIVTAAGDTEPGSIGRVSSASFPLGGKWASTTDSWASGHCEFNVQLGFNDATNPFVHTYHPDHDNWDSRYERPLTNKKESYSVTRKITLAFSPTPPPGVSDLGWGMTTLGGFYTETITGLRTQDITISGSFTLEQVSEADALEE